MYATVSEKLWQQLRNGRFYLKQSHLTLSLELIPSELLYGI